MTTPLSDLSDEKRAALIREAQLSRDFAGIAAREDGPRNALKKAVYRADQKSGRPDSGPTLTVEADVDDIAAELDRALAIDKLARAQGLTPQSINVTASERHGRWDGWENDGSGAVSAEQTSDRTERKASVTVKPPTVGGTPARDLVDVQALSKLLRRRLPTSKNPATPERWLVVNLADWQVGKGEGGGTPALAVRLHALAAAIQIRIREAAKLGRPYTGVTLTGMGDMVEQCSGHYAMQTFGSDLDRRGQVNFAADAVLVMSRPSSTPGSPG